METEKPTVLIVEDEGDLADLYADYLAEVATTKHAATGEQARDRMSEDVNVILLDRRLPDVMGEELIPDLREQNPTVGIAMVTAVQPDFDILDIGFDDYLTKPVDKASLRAVVRSLATRSRYGSAVREYFSLLSKRAALLTEIPEADLQENPDYQDLEDRITELKSEVDDLLAGFSEEDYIAQFRQLRPDPRNEPPEATSIRTELPTNDTQTDH